MAIRAREAAGAAKTERPMNISARRPVARPRRKSPTPKRCSTPGTITQQEFDSLKAKALHQTWQQQRPAEFWLWQNNDPERALRMAPLKFEIRPTRRARELLDRARRTACHPR